MARKTPGKRRGQGGNGQIPESDLELRRELIMVAKSEVGMRARREGLASAVDADLGDLDTLLKAAGAVCHPLFGDSEERVLETMAAMPAAEGPETELPDLSLYYFVDAPDEQLDDLCAKICETAAVETAYVKPPAHPAAEAAPVMAEAPGLKEGAINEMLPTGTEGLPATPNYTSRQGYLGPAAAGIDAQ